MSGYTIGEIIVWLLLAAILGFILGWLLRQMKCQREHGAAERTLGQAAPAKAAALSGDNKVESVEFAKSARPLAGGGAAKKAAATKAPVAKKAAAKKTVVAKAPAAKKVVTKAPAAKKVVTKAPAAKKAAAKKVAKKAPAEQAVTVGRFSGSAKPLSGGRAPSADYRIKGNEDSMIYHTPDSPFYGQTIAETWFKTEAAAVAAGFRKPKNA